MFQYIMGTCSLKEFEVAVFIHFCKAKITFLILLFLKIVHIYVYYNLSLLY